MDNLTLILIVIILHELYLVQKEIKVKYSNILSFDLNSNDLVNLRRYRDFL